MELIADILLVAGAVGAGLYCAVLARRLNRFNDLEKGVGGAVAVLSAQVDDMTRILKAAQDSAGKSGEALEALTRRAEGAAHRLELMMASLHDLPEPAQATPPGDERPIHVQDPSRTDVAPPAAQPVPEPETSAPAPARAQQATVPIFMRNPRARSGAAV